MIIRSVRLHNIRSYLDETVEFPEGSVMLSGDIGSGKSTILLAVEFALFGVLRGVLDGSALLRHGKTSGFVELGFSVGGRDVVVRRELKRENKREKSAVSQDSGYLIVDGVKLAATPVELKARVLDLLGYPPQLLTKSKEMVYRFTVYTPQEEMKRILFEDSGLRLDTLRRVFQIDRYRRVRENALLVLQELRSLQRELSARADGLDGKQRQRSELDVKLKEAEAVISNLEPRLQEHKEVISAKKGELKVFESRISELNGVRRQADVLKAKHGEKLLLKKGFELDIISAEKKVAELQQKLKLAGSSLAEADILLKLGKVENCLEEVNKVISQHEFMRSDSGRKKQQLVSLDNCPTCFQPVSAEHKRGICSVEDEKISAASAVIVQKTAEKKLLQDNLSKLRDSHKSSIEVKHFAAQLEEKQEQLKMLAGKKAAVGLELSSLDSGAVLLEGKLQGFAGVEECYQVKRQELEHLLSLEKELLVKKAQSEAEKAAIASNMGILDSEIAEKLLALERLSAVKQYSHWLEEFFINLVVDIEKHVLVSINESFNDFFRQWFGMLMEDGGISAGVDSSFSPVVEQNGYEADITNLSGGEKTSCALAYRLALNKVINSMITGIKTRDLIILDEPTDGFSSEQLEKVRDVINELNAKQLIIVSHEPKVEGFVDKVIKVVKQDHVSKVV